MTAKREPPIGLRPTPDERALWTEAALAMGNTLSGFMRWGINRIAHLVPRGSRRDDEEDVEIAQASVDAGMAALKLWAKDKGNDAIKAMSAEDSAREGLAVCLSAAIAQACYMQRWQCAIIADNIETGRVTAQKTVAEALTPMRARPTRPPTCAPAPNLCDDPTGCTDPREDCAEVLGVARGEGGD